MLPELPEARRLLSRRCFSTGVCGGEHRFEAGDNIENSYFPDIDARSPRLTQASVNPYRLGTSGAGLFWYCLEQHWHAVDQMIAPNAKDVSTGGVSPLRVYAFVLQDSHASLTGRNQSCF